MYPYGPNTPGYGPPPGYGQFPGQPPNPVPGMNFPPPPGVAPAPGMDTARMPQAPTLPGSLYPAAPHIANIDMNAKVIRLGTGSRDTGTTKRDSNAEPLGSRRGGVGFGREGERREQDRPGNYMVSVGSHEEMMRTIGVWDIPEDIPDNVWLERILGAAGGLRLFTRVLNSNFAPTAMGFAEYDDADSLRAAIDLLKEGVEVPVNPRLRKSKAGKTDTNGVKKEDGAHADDSEARDLDGNDIEGDLDKSEPDVHMMKITADEKTTKYCKQWEGRGEDVEEKRMFRVQSAKDELERILAELVRSYDPQNGPETSTEKVTDAITGEVVEIPLTQEDELADIPPESRDQVAKEILQFREASLRKDKERLKKQEEEEELQRRREQRATDTGAGGANNIPLGPKFLMKPQGEALTGPKGHRLQEPFRYPAESHTDANDMVVNRTRDGVVYRVSDDGQPITYDPKQLTQEPGTDEDIRQSRLARERKTEDEEYQRKLYTWERSEKNSRGRQDQRMADKRLKEADEQRNLDMMREGLATFDDEEEARKAALKYFADIRAWNQEREDVNKRRHIRDKADRAEEQRELSEREERRAHNDDEADAFLSRTANELEHDLPREPQRFKMSLGAAAQKAQTKPSQRRTMAEIEGLLDNEDEDGPTDKRPTLVPMADSSTVTYAAAHMTDEERQEARHKLVNEIPSDRDDLFQWSVKWDSLEAFVIEERIRPYAEKKVAEVLGVSDAFLVDVIEEQLKEKCSPAKLLAELQEAVGEEAEALVQKIWRMVVFCSESEARGIGV